MSSSLSQDATVTKVWQNSWARTLSAGYTVNTYSKPPLYDASKGNDVWFSQRAGFLRGQTDTNQPASQNDIGYPAESWEIHQ